MSVLGRVRQGVRQLLRRQGFEIVEARHLYDWQIPDRAPPRPLERTVPANARDYLTRNNPRLAELKDRYRAFGGEVGKTLVWTEDYLSDDDLTFFRDDNPYVFQLRGRNMSALSYALTYFAARASERGGQLLNLLDEDRLFGVNSFEIDGRHVSRDLLDSVAELRFLERHLGGSLAGAVLLDIGAGYGRLAYRTLTAWPSIGRYLCTDAIAESSFLCEYYLAHRGVDHKATVVPLDEIDRELAKSSPQIAVNIHSFSECSLEAINWWCALLARHRVPLVMIVPNRVGSDGMSLLTNDGKNFAPVLEAHGYRLRTAEPKYLDPVVQNYGINPAVHFLYGRDGV
jgi:hypothetical protein